MQRPSLEASREDLGFGSRIMQDSSVRLLNRDGSFNVSRRGLPLRETLSIYQALLATSWSKFIALVLAVYMTVNLVFATAFLLCGPTALSGITASGFAQRLLKTFFFSVHTITTVGYGDVVPQTVLADLLVTLEAFLGLSGFAVMAALTFARFSRPTAKVLFSHTAILGPYHDRPAFSFRIANGGTNELVEVSVRVLFSKTEDVSGRRLRRFHELELERQKVAFLPVDWTIVHPIGENSPLRGVTPALLRDWDAEFLILINAIDETFTQTVHARSSYRWEEVQWDVRFKELYRETRAGRMVVDLRRLHDTEHVAAEGEVQQTVWDFSTR